MKKIYQSSALLIPMLYLLSCISAHAGETDDIEIMKQQIQELISQNQQLNQRLTKMEQGAKAQDEKMTKIRKKLPVQAEPNTNQDSSSMIGKYISFAGEIEVEASWRDDFDGVSSSSIDLATTEFTFEAQVSEWATGIIAIEWDGDEDRLTVDEAFILIGKTDTIPGFLLAGRFIVPFGIYVGNTIVYPLTKEAFETKEDALMAGFESNGFYANAYVFNGETNEGGGDDTIEQFGGNLGYRLDNEEMAVGTSIDFISSVFDSDGLTDGFPDSLESDYTPGLAVHAIFGIRGFGIIGEFITALNEVDGVEPKAWQIEGFFETEVAGHELIFSLGYSATEELGSILPKSRIAASLGVDLFDGLGVTFEYLHDKDYEESDGGTDETADAFTTQLAYEF